MKVPVEDLLDIKYVSGGTDPAGRRDCLWAVRRVLERVFPGLEPSELPVDGNEGALLLSAARAGENRWSHVGTSGFSANTVGDVIYGKAPDGRVFVAAVIDSVGRIAFTASPEHGTHRIPIRKLIGVDAVYRRRTR